MSHRLKTILFFHHQPREESSKKNSSLIFKSEREIFFLSQIGMCQISSVPKGPRRKKCKLYFAGENSFILRVVEGRVREKFSCDAFNKK